MLVAVPGTTPSASETAPIDTSVELLALGGHVNVFYIIFNSGTWHLMTGCCRLKYGLIGRMRRLWWAPRDELYLQSFAHEGFYGGGTWFYGIIQDGTLF
jgi:hypothetical protein